MQTSKAGSVKALLVFFYVSRGWLMGFSWVSKTTDATMGFYKEAIVASVYVWELVMLARHSSWRGRCGGGSPQWLAQVLCQGRYLRSRPDQRNRWRAEGALQGASRGYRYTASKWQCLCVVVLFCIYKVRNNFVHSEIPLKASPSITLHHIWRVSLGLDYIGD